MRIKSQLVPSLVAGVLALGLASNVRADAGVNPGDAWLGFINVSNLPQTDGAYQFGSPWGTADLTAVFSSSVLTLGPNTIGDPDPYWYIGGGGPGAIGNKIMDANMYVETTGVYSGQTLTFSGNVLANTLAGQVDQLGNGWTSVAFIKDFAPDYSSFVSTTIPLTPGAFSISLALDPDSARHIQYGFETIGPCVWATDVGPYGNIQIEAVPEPTSLALLGLGSIGLLALRRKP